MGVGRGRRVQGGRMLQEFEFDSTETNSNTTRIQIKTTTPSSRPQLFNSIDLYLNPSTNIKRVRSSYLPATAQETTPIYYTSRKGRCPSPCLFSFRYKIFRFPALKSLLCRTRPLSVSCHEGVLYLYRSRNPFFPFLVFLTIDMLFSIAPTHAVGTVISNSSLSTHNIT